MQFQILAVLLTSALSAMAFPSLSEDQVWARSILKSIAIRDTEDTMIARQSDGACTFAAPGTPPINNGSNGCVPIANLGFSPGVINCNNGVPTTKDCGVLWR
ncbi:hypothetical protein PLICRDRAFT_173111 [Plicaturopsis crispa FD-325 SS-3]|nr:hypothetical protein PLICRDRAFT_173111 [Plicaturopsis crispa FD-325 SS-3]